MAVLLASQQVILGVRHTVESLTEQVILSRRQHSTLFLAVPKQLSI